MSHCTMYNTANVHACKKETHFVSIVPSLEYIFGMSCLRKAPSRVWNLQRVDFLGNIFFKYSYFISTDLSESVK